MKLPEMKVKNFSLSNCIWQGGMGIGVSLFSLVGAVSEEGGLGIISSACLKIVVSKRDGEAVDTYTAVRIEIEKAQSASGGRPVGINVMCAIGRDYEDTIRASIDAKVSAIISGAGLPLGLPAIQPPKDTALIPIISSARALEIIVKRWERSNYRPDAVVLEGPLAGGHLGFSLKEVDDPAFALEQLLPAVLEVAYKYGNFPVIVAGGIYTHADIEKFLAMGASGVQMGTRFLATEESTATEEYKRAVVSAKEEDIVIADPGSPCGLPFRVIKQSPMYVSALKSLRKPKCDKGFVLLKDSEGKYTRCSAKENNKNFFCICNGLLSSAGYNPKEEPIYTVGTNASRVDKILSVKALMEELTGKISKA